MDLATTTSEPARRRRLPAVIAAALVVPALTVVGTAAPADAAWSTHMTIHHAKLQLCKVPVRGQRPWVRVRLDGRGSGHKHRASLSLSNGNQTRVATVYAAGGRISGTKRLRWRAGDLFSVGISEINGPGAGGGLDPSVIRVC